MKNRKLIVLTLISFVLALAAAAREDKLTNTGAAPAAEGKVITSNDRNGNTEVEVQVKHMATPQSLTPPRQTYLVWVQPRGQAAELLGALRVNSDSLEGSLKASTTYKDFEVLVTAEDQVHADQPSSTVILKGTVERK
ncbi:MAG TPA: hypothetical protein VE783_11465 [Candidatus Limnocylindrales bacterium]|nr:hypothetical protein [Candidatus Limnocylindrales bacterium]